MRRPRTSDKAVKRRGSKRPESRARQGHRSKPKPTLAELQKKLVQAEKQRSASFEVLKIIAKSEGELGPVFSAILKHAVSICDAKYGNLSLFDGAGFRYSAFQDTPRAFIDLFADTTVRPGPDTALGRLARTKRLVHIEDVTTGRAFTEGDPIRRATVDLLKARTLLAVPMLDHTRLVGAIVIYRQQVRPFTEQQIDLVTNFAHQAVVAIRNTRLFTETKEALERQTATAGVLEAINSSQGDLAPVFDTILRKAHALCGITSGSLEIYDGERFLGVAMHGVSAAFADVLRAGYIAAESPATVPLLAGHRVSHIHDALKVEFPVFRAAAELEGVRTVLFVPLRRKGRLLGMIAAARHEVKLFSEKEIGLLEDFAVQAAIAIENARLFNETREALERQTATADVLRVIASSPTDLQPVFDAIANRSKQLIGGFSCTVFRLIDGIVHLVAYTSVSAAADEVLKASFPRPVGEMSLFDMAKGQDIFEEPDAEDNPDARLRELARARGFRSTLFARLMNKGAPIGLIAVTRTQPGSFDPNHIQLLRAFADQAVIAIENARLFNETQDALERQTATADVLKVIASSPTNIQPVFDAIAERSNRLIEGHATAAYRFVGDMVELASFTPVNPEADAALQASFPRPIAESPNMPEVRAGGIVEIVDTEAEGVRPFTREVARNRGWRSVLFVPLSGDAGPIGAITVTRKQPGAFAPHHVELLRTFADQAVIAIQNVKLFDEVQARTRELSQSLDDLRAAQDRLVQTEKLASLGQLTAGIAHEIKNPLNFVNNFSALSAELIDEMTEVLENPQLDESRKRKELDEIRELLKSNLEKVVQHGKRADSIVKNMLLHSRSGAGEQRSVEINALVDESLNLAYHGARAESQGFNITLERDYDPTAGVADVFPQEITRVFLNMISNGFYAATKRAAVAGNGFQPIVKAVTRNLGDRVEIRIRDNGTGMAPEVKEQIFNPFFTTKPAGEGTGLGLSMSHDIVVKQHRGTIDVDTEPGVFTEFIITLPRNTQTQNPAGGAT